VRWVRDVADLSLRDLRFQDAVAEFASPLRGAWARDDGPWWLPFAVWLPIVVGLGWLVRERRAS